MGFSTKECAWSQTRVKILGRTLVGIAGFEFNDDIEKDHLFGAGNKPIDIQDGNETPTGSIDIYKYELDMLNDAANKAGYASISKVPHEAITITCTFKKLPTDAPKTTTAFGVGFKGQKIGMKQNDKSMSINLAFLAMEIVTV